MIFHDRGNPGFPLITCKLHNAEPCYCCDAESTPLALIQCRNNVVCPVGCYLSVDRACEGAAHAHAHYKPVVVGLLGNNSLQQVNHQEQPHVEVALPDIHLISL